MVGLAVLAVVEQLLEQLAALELQTKVTLVETVDLALEVVAVVLVQ
jgi:hypothetical protein